jgi:hypothetical protein
MLPHLGGGGRHPLRAVASPARCRQLPLPRGVDGRSGNGHIANRRSATPSGSSGFQARFETTSNGSARARRAVAGRIRPIRDIRTSSRRKPRPIIPQLVDTNARTNRLRDAHLAACFTRRDRLAILHSVPSLGGDEGEQAGQLSRRQFARATVKAGMAAGAAVWVAPQLSSVALAQTNAGSPPPSTTRPAGGGASEPSNPGNAGQAAGSAPGGGVGAPGVGAPGAGAPGAGAPGAGGELAFTGSDTRTLAATGGAAVATGSALVAAERLSRRRRPHPVPEAEDPIDETGR